MDTVLKNMANDHGLVIPRIRRAIEKADGTDALVVRNYLEALKSKAGMLKQKAYMDDQLTESVRVAMVGKIGMVECEVQMTLADVCYIERSGNKTVQSTREKITVRWRAPESRSERYCVFLLLHSGAYGQRHQIMQRPMSSAIVRVVQTARNLR